MTYNTGNALGSTDVRDLLDNAHNLDDAVNDIVNDTWVDRFGRTRKTLKGYDAAFEADQVARAAAFQAFLEATGWSSLGAYGAGVVITSHTQTVDYLGQPYSLKPSIPVSLDAPYVTTGVWATEGVNFKLVGDNSLRQDLASSLSGARLLAYRNRTAQDKFDDFISITDYRLPGDGVSWHLAYNRAIAVSPNVHFPRKADPVYLFTSTISMPDDGFIVATPGVVLSAVPSTDAAGTGVVSVLNTNGKSRLKLFQVKFDGGVRDVMTAKSFVRPVRFINCTDVQALGCSVVNNPDWSLSFENCDGVRVGQYTQRSFVYADSAMNTTRAGGRDGIHFLDCKNVYAADLDIESGDDCVGITSQAVGTHNINIKGVRGKSVIASLVIYNEEYASGTTDYAAMPMDGLNIEDVQPKYAAVVRNVVRVLKYNPLSTIRSVSVKGVRGTGYSHGLFLTDIEGLFCDDIDVASTQQHGVYIVRCDEARGSVRGKSALINFDGVNINACTNSMLTALSDGAANYGVHMLALVNCVVVPFAKNCGAAAFSSNAGGGCRMVNCIDTSIPFGAAVGDTASSYFGLVQAGNTRCRVGSGFTRKGFINTSGGPNPFSAYQEPTAAVRFKEETTGAITMTSPLGCIVTRDSLGKYRVTFDTPMRTTNFNFQVFATAVGAARSFRLVSNPSVTDLVFETIDSAGAVARCDMVSVLAFDL